MLVTTEAHSSSHRPEEVCHAANWNNITDQGGCGCSQLWAKAPVLCRDLQRGEQAGFPFPWELSPSQAKSLTQKDGKLWRKRYLLSPQQKRIRKHGARAEGIESTAQSQVLALGGGWKSSQSPICPLFPLPLFQTSHISLSRLVFRGACGLKGQPQHLISAVWIAQLE